MPATTTSFAAILAAQLLRSGEGRAYKVLCDDLSFFKRKPRLGVWPAQIGAFDQASQARVQSGTLRCDHARGLTICWSEARAHQRMQEEEAVLRATGDERELLTFDAQGSTAAPPRFGAAWVDGKDRGGHSRWAWPAGDAVAMPSLSLA